MTVYNCIFVITLFILSKGTAVLLDVCKEVGVRRFLYCSSMSVISGFDDIINGTEETTSIPKRFINRGYGETKQKAESLVLSFNSEYSSQSRRTSKH